MSWSIVTNEAHPAHEIADEVRQQEPSGQTREECGEQVEAAALAAQQLAESGALGVGRYTVVAAGHDNPDHGDRPGYSQPTITVTVRRVAYE